MEINKLEFSLNCKSNTVWCKRLNLLVFGMVNLCKLSFEFTEYKIAELSNNLSYLLLIQILLSELGLSVKDLII